MKGAEFIEAVVSDIAALRGQRELDGDNDTMSVTKAELRAIIRAQLEQAALEIIAEEELEKIS